MTSIERLERGLALVAPFGMRIGRTLGRTLYTREFDGAGLVIGMVDTVHQAQFLTDAVNALPALLRIAKAARAWALTDDGTEVEAEAFDELVVALEFLDEAHP